MIITCVFSPLINAYDYQVSGIGEEYNSSYWFLENDNGQMNIKHIVDGNIDFNQSVSSAVTYSVLRNIKLNTLINLYGYISNNDFLTLLKSDLNFLNDFYTQGTNQILNYFYNENEFGSVNYIVYNNYELLYNSDGMAVESIVNGVWAGLYSDSQKKKSGALYDKNGSMIYYNGRAVNTSTYFFVWLQRFTNNVVLDAFEEIRKSLVTVIIVSIVLVLGLFRLVLELLPSSISPRRRRYYGGGRGSLPDYGDGSQVAASVRARLSAKNKVLKSRSENQSAVSQSMQNGIIFDLENDR